VTVTELAETGLAYHAGYLTAMFGIPIVGLVLLIVGLRQRSQSRRLPSSANPMVPPGYPPPGPYPFGYPAPGMPPNTGHADQPRPPASPTYPQYYPTGYPAPRPRGSSGTALIVVGSILLGFGVLGILGGVGDAASRAGRSAGSANVGQCISAFSTQEPNRTPKPQDCNKPDSTLEVAAKGGSSAKCPDGKREGSDYSFLFDGTATLCLMLNLKQDRCYSLSGGAKDPTFAATSCDSSMPVIKAVKRIDGSADAELCPAGTKAISYQTPARLYCLQRHEV
jgi:hypothetical protein